MSDSLLLVAPEVLPERLETATLDQYPELKLVLPLFAYIHTDETIQEAAKARMADVLNATERAAAEKAFQIFDSIISYYPWMGDYAELQATNFQQFVEQEAMYLPHIVKMPLFLERYLDVGRKLYMLFELIEEAQQCFELVIAYQNNNDEALYALGRLAEHNQEYTKAITLYQKSIESNTSHLYAHLQLGLLLSQQQGEHKKAIEHYDQVIEQEPFMAATYVHAAEAYYALGEIKRAKQLIESALAINEYHEEAINLLGQIQWKADEDIEAAIATFERGLDHQVHGDSALLLASLGELHHTHLGEYQKAMIYYEKSLKVNPNQIQVLRPWLRLLESIQQDYGAMDMAYQNYLTLPQKDEEIRLDYANFLIKYLHDYEQAHRQLQLLLSLEPEHEAGEKLLRQIEPYIADEETGDEDSLDDDFDDFDDDNDDDDDDDDFVGGGAAGDN